MKKLSHCSALELIEVITTGSVSASHDACYLFRRQLTDLTPQERQDCYTTLVNQWKQYQPQHDRADNLDSAIYDLWCQGVTLVEHGQWVDDAARLHTEHSTEHKFYALAHAFWKREQQGWDNFPHQDNVFQYYARTNPLQAIEMMHQHVVKIDTAMFATTHSISTQWAMDQKNGNSALHMCANFLLNEHELHLIHTGLLMNTVERLMNHGLNLASNTHLGLGQLVAALEDQLPSVCPSSKLWAEQMGAGRQKNALMQEVGAMAERPQVSRRKI